jgi:hypothetical protein
MTYVAFVGSSGPLIGYTVYEGENTSPGATAAGDPVTARTLFMARLTGITVEDFESYPITGVGSRFLGRAVTRNGSTATITRTGATPTEYVVRDADANGRFNTTVGGENFLNTCTTRPGVPMVISFSTPIAVFGLYLTDLGDFLGQISIELDKVGGGTVSLDIGHTIGAPSGSLYFWGFVDQIDTYSQIRITCSTADDVFGIDDWVWATASYII